MWRIEPTDRSSVEVTKVTVLEGDVEVAYYQWWADDRQFPLRVARKDGAWVVQYKNVRLRPLSPRLFELPLHYRPVETAGGQAGD
ncbi:MAG TPA: hypothetical protein VFS39_07760 [Nitrospira sp.]|nr:hypothetical protein [Nitrospira sp.]